MATIPHIAACEMQGIRLAGKFEKLDALAFSPGFPLQSLLKRIYIALALNRFALPGTLLIVIKLIQMLK